MVIIYIEHDSLAIKKLYARDQETAAIFCNNETNSEKLYGSISKSKYFKDGINNFLVHNDKNAINEEKEGTKAAFLVETEIEAGESKTFDFRLSPHEMDNAFFDFDEIISLRQKESD
jgi:hypothetical protein